MRMISSRGTFFLLGIFLFAELAHWTCATPASSANAEKCNICGKALTDKFIRAGAYKLHLQCFRCSHCRQTIDRQYRQDQNRFFHNYCFRKMKGLACGHCGKVLGNTWINYDSGKYHETCYRDHIQPRCAICKLPIEKQFAEDGGMKYHVLCYRQHKLPKCVICVLPLEGTHLVDSWGNRFHGQHGEQPPTCFSCGRVISQTTSRGGKRLYDGRFICGICGPTSVITSDQVRKARDSTLKTLKSVGIGGFPREVGIRLVDRYQLNRLSKGLNLHMNGEMRGLTKSVETLEGDKRVESKHTLYLLKYLPALELEGILAHELMHVWLFERQVRLSLREIEGFCNLGNYLVFSRKPSPMASYLLKNLQTDADPIYGGGYRLMRKQLDAHGWENLLAKFGPAPVSTPKKKFRLLMFGNK